jgi:hypothetical protein
MYAVGYPSPNQWFWDSFLAKKSLLAIQGKRILGQWQCKTIHYGGIKRLKFNDLQFITNE